MAKLILTAILVYAFAFTRESTAVRDAAAVADPRVKVLQEQPLITPGPNILATTLLLTFPPNDQGAPPHYHSGPIIAHVMEGEFLFQMKGQPRRILRAGETFFELDRDIHVWGASATNSTVTKVLATVYGRPEENFVTMLKDHPRESYEDALAIARMSDHSVARNAPRQ